MIEQTIDQLTSRHIARCLDYLGETIAPVQEAAIKRAFRFLAEDFKALANAESMQKPKPERFINVPKL